MEASGIQVAELASANQKLQAADAEALLKGASKLVAMKGKKVEEFAGGARTTDEAVQAMLGPTGNLRAPTIRTGKTLLVGFNEEVFTEQFGV